MTDESVKEENEISPVCFYCILNYIDYGISCIQGEDRLNVTPDDSGIVNYKDEVRCNKQIFFNPNCYLQTLLDYIFEVTGFDGYEDYDFFNTNYGMISIKNPKWTPTTMATEIFISEEAYYIVFIERDHLNVPSMIRPLLCRNTDEYDRIVLIWQELEGLGPLLSFEDISSKKKKRCKGICSIKKTSRSRMSVASKTSRMSKISKKTKSSFKCLNY